MSVVAGATGQDPAGAGTGEAGGTGAGAAGAAAGGQAPPAAGAAAGTPPAAGGTAGANPDGEPNSYSKEYVAELRREAAKHRTANAETAAKLKAIEQEKLSDQEKKDLRAKELETENAALKLEVRRSTAITQAAKLGAVVPEAIVGLIPADAEDVNAAVNAIKKQFPALFKVVPSGTADAGAGGGGQPGGAAPKSSMNDFLRRAAGRNV